MNNNFDLEMFIDEYFKKIDYRVTLFLVILGTAFGGLLSNVTINKVPNYIVNMISLVLSLLFIVLLIKFAVIMLKIKNSNSNEYKISFLFHQYLTSFVLALMIVFSIAQSL